MDKVKRYKQIVKELTYEVGQLGTKPDDVLKTQFITDDEHGHYLLYFNGWITETKRTYGCFMHIDVTDQGKVWLQYDGTDLNHCTAIDGQGNRQRGFDFGF